MERRVSSPAGAKRYSQHIGKSEKVNREQRKDRLGSRPSYLA